MSKLPIPFLNKQNYVVLKCYTDNAAVLDYAPITLANKEAPVKNDIGNKKDRSFAACYGRVMSLDKSATIVMPCDLEMTFEGRKIKHISASTCIDVLYDHIFDPIYKAEQTAITKITMPWALEEKTGVNFVLAKHIMNTTPMNIPSGMTSFGFQHSLNIFNQMMTKDHTYKVDWGTPIASLYLVSEKKLIVQSIYDKQNYEKLSDKNHYRPTWRASGLKLYKKFKR